MNAEAIIRTVCQYYAISQSELCSSRRDARVAAPRQIAMFLCRAMSPAKVREIAAMLNRHHSDVSKSQRVVLNRLTTEPAFRTELGEVTVCCLRSE